MFSRAFSRYNLLFSNVSYTHSRVSESDSHIKGCVNELCTV